ncbi:hypothetical protein JRQ81_000510 [Phrynocephalus forsythii]|uniref:Fanconi anemia group F protein n=1 Tax=Phrynocephalus forsythii TaxID=171643 RepID=A0A9Q0Y5G6_9SAUR|nr:hypothetical protein JRQ81_000510 [Phrynocephalus forsythii]
METLLSRAEQLPSLLAASRSEVVQGWDPATLTRALGWARFYQQLHRRLGAQPGLRASLERRLSRAGLLGLGHWRRCPDLLASALLENRALPASARHRLLRGLFLPPSRPGEEEEEPFVHLLARRKAALQLLLLGCWPRGTGQPDDAERRDGLVVKAQAQLLLRRLREESEAAGPKASWASSAALLEQLPCGPTLYRAVAAALLEPDGEAEAKATLLPWLTGDPARLAALGRLLPAPRVASLCRRHPELSAPYLRLLSSWGARLVYDPFRGEWRASSGWLEEGEVPWQELRERVRCLWQEPGPLGSAVRTQLRLWKAQEGDFEVPGLSVWSDLLMDMETSASGKGGNTTQ